MQVHTIDGQKFGVGNLGMYGIEKFLESHRCNHICEYLKLRALPNNQKKEGGTAAPKKAMPFKQVCTALFWVICSSRNNNYKNKNNNVSGLIV